MPSEDNLCIPKFNGDVSEQLPLGTEILSDYVIY